MVRTVRLANRTREQGGPGERRDFFLITADELDDFGADPHAFGSVIDELRTDPAWTPLFLAAAAVVLDVGA